MQNSNKILKFIKLTMNVGVLFLLTFMFYSIVFAQPAGNTSGWHLLDYSFKDGTARYETALMGTNSKMYDLVSHKGGKGNIEISQKRYDTKTGKMLAGVTYKVIWSDPPKFLKPGEKAALDYQLSTISSLTWKPPQQTVHLNQGLNGVYFTASDGTKFITKNLKDKLTSEKVIEKGTAGSKRTIKVTLGNGYSAIYSYEWR